MIRVFFCLGPTFLFTFPMAMIGFPLFLCFIFALGIFGLGWQVTGQNDMERFYTYNNHKEDKNEIKSAR